jgi:5-methylcytosine-specific restriction endonuclease McrA
MPYNTAAWATCRTFCLKRAGYKCERCGRRDPPLIVHHLDEEGLAGLRAYDPTNLEVLCRHCHPLAHRHAFAQWPPTD